MRVGQERLKFPQLAADAPTWCATVPPWGNSPSSPWPPSQPSSWCWSSRWCCGPHVQRRWFAGTGVERWRDTARQLPWRDRWSLYWANSWGRVAPRRLAPLAVERGEILLAMTNRMLTKRSKVRRFWQALGVFWGILILFDIWRLATWHSDEWINLVSAVVGLLVVFLAIGPLQKWQARLIQRSIDRNREQLAGDG